MWSQYHLLAHVYTYDSYSQVQGFVCVCVFVWAHVSRDVAALHGATLPMTVTAVEGVTLWQSQRGLELSCSSAPSSALCRGEGGTLFLCLDPLPQNPPTGLASALCRQCPPAAVFGKQKEVPLGAAGGGRSCPAVGSTPTRGNQLKEAQAFRGPGFWRHADQG